LGFACFKSRSIPAECLVLFKNKNPLFMSKKEKVWTKEQLEFQKLAQKEIELLRKNPDLMLAPYEELTPIEPNPKKKNKLQA
jgi:hypothetical protein